MTLPGANVRGDPIEVRDTVWENGRERFANPSAPQYIAWYERFGRPGTGAGTNSLFAAHINYVNYGDGPFRYLASASAGDTLTIAMANGATYRYTVRSVEVIALSNLDMNQVVYPSLGLNTERVTLISCGGTFVPNPNGPGGHYDSRVVLVAERQVG